MTRVKNSPASLTIADNISRMQQDVQLLADQIRSAAQSNSARPLRIRGGGTKDFLGAALQGEVLDTRGINQVVAYEPTE